MQQQVAQHPEERGLRESKTKYPCAHGLLGTGRTGGRYYEGCRCDAVRYDLLDHGRLWLADGRPAFLLAHTYMDVSPGSRVRRELDGYVAQHGLRVVIGDPVDDWYGHGTTPLRYEASHV